MKQKRTSLGNGSADHVKESKDSPLFETTQTTEPPTNKKFVFFRKAKQKKQLVNQCLELYKKPVRTAGVTHEPTLKEIKKYETKLKSLKVKDLQSVSELREYNLKLDKLDRLKSLDKKKYAVVTVFNDNKTTDTGVCHCYSRSFSRCGMRYIVMSERGIYDPEFRMTHFYYYANMPFPIVFEKGMLPEGQPDGKLLDATIEMSVLEALANINIDKKVNMLVIIGIFTLVLVALNTFLTVKASGII